MSVRLDEQHLDEPRLFELDSPTPEDSEQFYPDEPPVVDDPDLYTDSQLGLPQTFSPPALNIDLLRRAVAWVVEQAKKPAGLRQWAQGEWMTENVCGTACCIAGWACLDAGAKPVQYAFGLDPALVVLADGERRPVKTLAKKLFGLSEFEANALFASINDSHDIHKLADEVAASRGYTL